ncbi:MAG TPA: PEP-CTERM sorting domain-containing protein [Vicinamibacterales bacterium]|nr:PEP-CTERM sorting domain-containing protein [Vicinamibacterales bacterium]
MSSKFQSAIAFLQGCRTSSTEQHQRRYPMRTRRNVFGLMLAGVLCCHSIVGADTITYNDFASWQTAAGAVTTITFEENNFGMTTWHGCCATFGGIFFGVVGPGGSAPTAALFTVDPGLSPSYATIGTGDVLSAWYANALEISGLNATALAFNWTQFGSDISVHLSTGDTLVLAAPALTPNFIGLTSTSPITSLRFTLPPIDLDAVWFSTLNIDNLAFNGASPAPVPEPATLFLMGSGLAAIGRRVWMSEKSNRPVTGHKTRRA